MGAGICQPRTEASIETNMHTLTWTSTWTSSPKNCEKLFFSHQICGVSLWQPWQIKDTLLAQNTNHKSTVFQALKIHFFPLLHLRKVKHFLVLPATFTLTRKGKIRRTALRWEVMAGLGPPVSVKVRLLAKAPAALPAHIRLLS